ncbi:MAG: phosphoesterase [Bradyrhizobiaceae bacterium]|nr:MAG: phosphoesterase [Bradyrhizobiaceae bacterium]
MSTTSKIDTLFSGISNTSSYPPHNGLAVGPNNIVMAEGSRIEWTNLTGGAATIQSVYSFFSSLGATATNSLYDPRCIYDSASGRFIIIMENIGSNGAVSNIDIAVSKDSNPNDGWYFASLNTSLTINGQLTSSDRPSITVDGSNIYITAPQYNVNVSGYAGTETWVIGKTAGAGGGLYNGGTMTVVANQITPSNQGIFTVATGSNGTTYYACDYSTGSQIVAVVQTYNTATGTFGPATTITLGNIDQGGSYTAQQQGTTLLLDAGDKRIQSLQYANGFLWGVCELKPIGSSVPLVHWFKIDVSNPNSPTLVAQGDISGASLGTNVATFNGSLAVDGAGDVLINFTASGPNTYPSDYYVYAAASAPAGSFSSPILYQASTGFFNSGNGSSVQRWGAYSTAIPDPNNPNAFWISNEYVASGWWQTAVSQIEVGTTTNPTISLIAVSGTGVTNGSGDLNAGKAVTLTVTFSSAVTVNTTGGAPTLTLNDGGTATYVGGSGSSALTFSYVVASGQNTSDLSISSANLNGAIIRDQLGNNADLSGAANYNPAGILQIDTATPAAPTALSLDTTTDSGTKGDGITNATQVKIDGSAEPGSTVTLYNSNGTTVLGTGIADATTGAFAITTAALAGGTHTITAKSTDLAGNTSIASAARTITIDTTAPGAPTGLSLDTSTDSGTKGDGITSSTQIEIDGSAAPGSAVTLYDTNGTTIIGTGTANATTGAFSITTSVLAIGNHSITAKAADVAGNVSTASAPYSVTVTAPTYDHIVVVIDENKNYSDVIGNAAAPFINSLVASGTLFTSYSAVTHPSEPNYLALFSGSTQGVTDDGIYFFPNAPTLAGELIQAGYTFTGYAESSSTRSHDPWESFGDSQNLGQSFSQFPTDFNQLPTVSFVIPNLNDDMHDGTVAQGDQWLSDNLSAYAAWAQANNSLLIVTFDESDSSSSNQIPTIIVGDGIPVGENTQALNHYSLLHTIEDIYGLPGLTTNDTSAPVINFSAVNPPAVTSEIETQFSGISDPSSYPPHNALAVGSNYIVMAEGSKIEWSNLTGGASTTQSVYQFFKSLGSTATNALFDPRIAYDSVNGRYIVTMDNIGSNGTVSNIDIAVSKDSNPNDGWYFASLNTSLTLNGSLTSSDTPVVSVDGTNIYITAPQYNVSGGGWQGTAVWVIGDIVGAGGGIYNGGTMTVTASEVTSPSQGIYRVVAGGNGYTYYASSYSTGGQIVVTLQAYNVATNTFGAVSTIGLGKIDQGGSYTAQQLGTSLLLDATDKRVQNLAYSNGFLYGITEEKPIGSSVPLVHWFKIDVSNPNSPTLVAQGDISGASLGTNVATFNGSIAVDGAGDVLINFTASGPNMYPSDYYVYQSAGNGVGSFSAPILYQASSGFFNSGNGSSVQRWGINSTTIADPNNAHGFWVSNEYVANGWWQTSVTEISIQPSLETPTLTLGSTALTVNAGSSATLPISVAGFDADDTVTVAIGGLTSYETITDTLDKQTFSGSSVTLTAAEVNSGLSLQSSYAGTDHPVNTLTITASNTTAGESATSAAQTITVTDPPASPAMTWSNWNQHNSSFQHLTALMEQYMAAGLHGAGSHNFGSTNDTPTHFNPEEQPFLGTSHHSHFS